MGTDVDEAPAAVEGERSRVALPNPEPERAMALPPRLRDAGRHESRTEPAAQRRLADVETAQLQSLALGMANELAANAPLSQIGNKRVIAALLRAQAALPEDVEADLIELRRASFASQDLREGMAAFAEKRSPRWRGE